MEGGTILDYKIIRIILRYMKLFGKLVIFVEGWGGIVRVFKCFAIMIMFQCLLFLKLYKENQYSILNT